MKILKFAFIIGFSFAFLFGSIQTSKAAAGDVNVCAPYKNSAKTAECTSDVPNYFAGAGCLADGADSTSVCTGQRSAVLGSAPMACRCYCDPAKGAYSNNPSCSATQVVRQNTSTCQNYCVNITPSFIPKYVEGTGKALEFSSLYHDSKDNVFFRDKSSDGLTLNGKFDVQVKNDDDASNSLADDVDFPVTRATQLSTIVSDVLMNPLKYLLGKFENAVLTFSGNDISGPAGYRALNVRNDGSLGFEYLKDEGGGDFSRNITFIEVDESTGNLVVKNQTLNDNGTAIDIDNNNVADVNNITVLGPVGGGGSGNTASYVGAVASGNATDGSAGGYINFNGLCSAAYAGSKVCTSSDVIGSMLDGSLSAGTLSTLAGAADFYWIMNGAPGALDPVRDCYGWNTNDSAEAAAIFIPSTKGFALKECNNNLMPLCCS